MSKVDWKQKYMELRAKYLNAVDVGFRLGVEEGKRQAEMEALQMQIQQLEEQAAMAEMGGGMPGEEMPPEEMPMEGEEMPPEEGMEEEAAAEGDELGQSIDELEGYVKNEEKFDAVKLMKSVHKSKSKKEEAAKSSEAHKKINNLIKKWDEENEQDTENGEIIGQA